MTLQSSDLYVADVEEAREEARGDLDDTLPAFSLAEVPEGPGAERDEWLDACDRIGCLLAEIKSLADNLRTTLAFLGDEFAAD